MPPWNDFKMFMDFLVRGKNWKNHIFGPNRPKTLFLQKKIFLYFFYYAFSTFIKIFLKGKVLLLITRNPEIIV